MSFGKLQNLVWFIFSTVELFHQILSKRGDNVIQKNSLVESLKDTEGAYIWTCGVHLMSEFVHNCKW